MSGRAAPTCFAVVTGGGTSGHVLPALAIAEGLVAAGHEPATIHYVGAQRGIETRLVPPTPFPHTFLDVIGLQRRLDRSNLLFPLKLVRATARRVPPPPTPSAPRRGLRRRLRQPPRRDRRPPAADPGRRGQLRPPPRAVEPPHRPLRRRQRGGVPRLAPAPCEVHGGAAAPGDPGRRSGSRPRCRPGRARVAARPVRGRRVGRVARFRRPERGGGRPGRGGREPSGSRRAPHRRRALPRTGIVRSGR